MKIKHFIYGAVCESFHFFDHNQNLLNIFNLNNYFNSFPQVKLFIVLWFYRYYNLFFLFILLFFKLLFILYLTAFS